MLQREYACQGIYAVRQTWTRKEPDRAAATGLDNRAFGCHDRLFGSSFSDGSTTQILEDGDARRMSDGGLISPGGVE
jgi:hypothetical protein